MGIGKQFLPLPLIAATMALGFAEHASLGDGFYLERSTDGFGVRSHGIVERVGSHWKRYPLPQSNANLYRKLRPKEQLRSAKDYHGQEVIGPYQVEGPLIWFGNQYYDGEGETGVGAFGYFDKTTRRYQIFHLPEIAPWEITSLLVEADTAWLGLDHFGEDISRFPGGLVRWDQSNQEAQHYDVEFVITSIQRKTPDSPVLRLGAESGYAFFENGKLRRFLVKEASNGKKVAVPIQRFPPPPSNQ